MPRRRLRISSSARTSFAKLTQTAARESGSRIFRPQLGCRVARRPRGPARAHRRRPAAGRRARGRSGAGTGRRRSRRPARRGSPPASPRRRCRPRRRGICSTSWQNWCVVAMVAASNAGQRVAQSLRRRSAVPRRLPSSRCAITWLSPTRHGVAESRYRIDDLAAHAVAQLLRGRPAEGDQQHLVQRRHALGDVPGDQTGQRERLAGARAGLQHGGRPLGGQRTQQIEAVHHAPSMARSIGSHSTRRRRSSRPASIEDRTARRPDPMPARAPAPASSPGYRVGSPPVPRRPFRIAVAVLSLRPCIRRLDRQRQWLAPALVVDRHQIGQQVDRGFRGASEFRPAVAWFPSWGGRCRRPTSRVAGS